MKMSVFPAMVGSLTLPSFSRGSDYDITPEGYMLDV